MSAFVAGLIVALPEECRSLTDRRVRHGDCFALTDASLVCIAGVGAGNAARAARSLIEGGARGLLSWGCAAALCPALKPGTLCLPTEILDLDGTRHAVSADWHQRTWGALRAGFDPRTDPLLTSNHLVRTAVDKQTLAAKYRAVAVDMESAAVAAVAHLRDVPFLVVRAIADPAHLALPRSVVRATDAQGTTHRSAMLGHALRHPGELYRLLRLALHFRAALRTLTGAAQRMGGGFLLDAASAA